MYMYNMLSFFCSRNFEIYITLCKYSYQSFLQESKNKTKYWLFNVLCWLWNIYEGAELLIVYFITNTKHCITYLALAQLFPVLLTHRPHIVKYKYYVVFCCISFRSMSFRF